MTSPIWVIVYDRRDGVQSIIVRCAHALEAEHTVYHNTYYGHRCLKVTVKEFR